MDEKYTGSDEPENMEEYFARKWEEQGVTWHKPGEIVDTRPVKQPDRVWESSFSDQLGERQ